jgi:hypothetical protein
LSVVQGDVMMLCHNSEADIRMGPWRGVQNILESELMSYLIIV